MSEQPHYNTTPDQGWDRMRSILNRELPVSRRRNNFVLFWRIFNAALILGVLGVGMYKGIYILANKPLPVEDTLHTEDQDRTMSPNGLNEKSSQTAVPSSGMQETSPSHIQPITKRSEANLKNAGPDTKKPNVNSSSQPKLTEPMAFNKTDLEAGQNAIPPTPKNAEHEQDNVVTTSGSPSTSLPMDILALSAEPIDDLLPLRNGQDLDPVPSVPFDLITSAFSETVGPITPVLTKVRRDGISVKPYVAIEGLAGFSGGTGGQVGAGLDVGFSKRLTWSAGAAYRDFSPNSSFLIGSRDFAGTPEANAILNLDSSYGDFPAYIEGDLLSASSEYNAIIPFVDQVRQWQIQTGVRYNITKRFFADGGLMHAFKTNVTTQYPILTGDPLISIPGVRVSNSLNEFDKVRSSMTSWFAGVGFTFGRHLSVQARWTHGFQQYLLTTTTQGNTSAYGSDRSDTIRGLSVGIKYTL